MPLTPGIRISEISTCGVSASSAVSTSWACAKARQGRLALASARSSTQRIERSSSTIQIGFMLHASSQRQKNPKIGAPWSAFEVDRAAVLVNELLRDRQPQPAAAFSPRHQRVEHALPQLVGNPGSVIDHTQI